MSRARLAALALAGASAAGLAPAHAGAEAGAAAGKAVYDTNCSVCHQAAGAGMAGAYPKLAGSTGVLAGQPAGRRVMIAAVLHGMAGKLQSGDETLVGVMTPFGQLADADIADVLTYLAGLEGKTSAPFAAAEVAKERAKPALTPTEVNALARDPALRRASP